MLAEPPYIYSEPQLHPPKTTKKIAILALLSFKMIISVVLGSDVMDVKILAMQLNAECNSIAIEAVVKRAVDILPFIYLNIH